jgi:glycine hydroxymethyltransferase
MDEVRSIALRERPAMILCGGTAIPRVVDFPAFAAVADEVGAVLVADIAHIAGLVVGGAHPTPVGHAAIVTTTTHKTLRGPRGAMILSDARFAEAVDRAVFPGLQGGPHDHTTAAIAVALHEAALPSFSEYAHAIVANAVALGEALAARGFSLVSGGTDNHLLLVDVTPLGVSGGVAARRLDEAGIVTNKNAIPFDTRPPMDPSGLRIGTPAVTTRGLGVDHMDTIAGWMDRVVRGDDVEAVRAEVTELATAYPPPGY